MRQGEIREVNGYFVRKTTDTRFRNRDGYAKACYKIYENMEDAKNAGRKGCISVCFNMKEVKEATKD